MIRLAMFLALVLSTAWLPVESRSTEKSPRLAAQVMTRAERDALERAPDLLHFSR